MDEMARMPTGDECEFWQTGDLCGQSDCRECGPDVTEHLITEARHGFRGLMRLAREVWRIQDKYGSNIPDGPVVIGDVCRAVFQLTNLEGVSVSGRLVVTAWCEGLVDALSYAPMPQSESECYPVEWRRQLWLANHERWCYFLGRAAPSLHRLHSFLRAREAQAMADADITSAAGVVSAPPTTPTLRARTPADEGPGWESRAQHR